MSRGHSKPSILNLSIKLIREDRIPAFGAFLRCEEQNDDSPVIALNVEALMCPEMESEDGVVVVSREERIRLIISILMHEFGHALEAHFQLPVNEEAIEAACAEWEKIQHPS